MLHHSIPHPCILRTNGSYQDLAFCRNAIAKFTKLNQLFAQCSVHVVVQELSPLLCSVGGSSSQKHILNAHLLHFLN